MSTDRIDFHLSFMNPIQVERSKNFLPRALPSMSPTEWLCVSDADGVEKFYMLSESQVAKVLAVVLNSIEMNSQKLDVEIDLQTKQEFFKGYDNA